MKAIGNQLIRARCSMRTDAGGMSWEHIVKWEPASVQAAAGRVTKRAIRTRL